METSGGDHYDDPSEDLLHLLLTELRAPEDYFIVEFCSDVTGQTYLQATRAGEQYQLERRAGSEATHQHAFTADLALAHAALASWVFGDVDEPGLHWAGGYPESSVPTNANGSPNRPGAGRTESSAEVSETDKAIAGLLKDVFGGAPRVHRYRDDDGAPLFAVLSSADRPAPGVTSYGTVGVSKVPMYSPGQGDQHPVRVELVGACASAYAEFGPSFVDAGEMLTTERRMPSPGAILSNVVRMSVDTVTTVKHFFLVEPFLWEGLTSREVHGQTIAWLMAVPITDAERQYAIDHGWQALEELFGEHQIDVYDIARKSIV